MYGHGQNLYPPASRYRAGLAEADLRSAIGVSNDEPIPRALALTLRLPTRDLPEFEGDIARLHREIDMIARLIDRDREVVGLHFTSCGMPGPLSVDAVRDLSEDLRHQFHFSRAVTSEYSVSVDPGAIDPSDVAGLAAADLNRIRFTATRVDAPTLQAVRVHGFRSMHIVAHDREDAISCAGTARPDRLSVQRIADDSFAPAREADNLRDHLLRLGYLYIGPGEFALPGDDIAVALVARRLRCGPFGYTAHAECDSVGFGAGAISQLAGYLSQNAESLVDWRRDLDIGRLPARRGLCLSKDDELRIEVIEQLLCRRQVEVRELERRYRIDFRSYFAADLARLAPWFTRGEVQDLGGRIAVCSQGWPCLDRIARCFDAYANDGVLPPEAELRH